MCRVLRTLVILARPLVTTPECGALSIDDVHTTRSEVMGDPLSVLGETHTVIRLLLSRTTRLMRPAMGTGCGTAVTGLVTGEFPAGLPAMAVTEYVVPLTSPAIVQVPV